MQTKQKAQTRLLQLASRCLPLLVSVVLVACASVGGNVLEDQVRQRAT